MVVCILYAYFYKLFLVYLCFLLIGVRSSILRIFKNKFFMIFIMYFFKEFFIEINIINSFYIMVCYVVIRIGFSNSLFILC